MSSMESVPQHAPRPAVDPGGLWAGGVATAVVAALVALAGVLIWDGVLDVEMVEPPLLEVGESFNEQYAVTAAVLALAATGLAHLLILAAPRPLSFFTWIMGLATVVGFAIPFTLDGTTEGQVATSTVNLVLGLCITSLVYMVANITTDWKRTA